MDYRAPKGTTDVIPAQSYKWHYIESKIREVCALYGVREVRTPVFEHTELFLRGVGDTTDIVQKEMYTFEDKGGRSITLKPEGTAGAARCFVERKLYNEALPAKMYYLNSPTFRYENPQAGRYREHHQFGIEVFGAPQASCDAEIISLAWAVIQGLGVKKLTLHINSIGCPECRPKFNEALKSYFAAHVDELCDTCKGRLERNPLRILDCKSPVCKQIAQGAPKCIDHLCPDCKAHMDELENYLARLGIPYEIDPMIVRGLDYYTRTVFEIISTDIGAQGTVCGGGRYDGLVEQVGGPAIAGIGFGMGMERLLLVMESLNLLPEEPAVTQVYVASLGEEARGPAFGFCNELRLAGVRADMDHVGRSLKAQFKFAGKSDAPFVAIMGGDELASGQVKLRNMATREEELLPLDTAAAAIAARLAQ